MGWGIDRAGLVQSLEIICRAGRGRGGCGKGMNGGGARKLTWLDPGERRGVSYNHLIDTLDICGCYR